MLTEQSFTAFVEFNITSSYLVDLSICSISNQFDQLKDTSWVLREREVEREVEKNGEEEEATLRRKNRTKKTKRQWKSYSGEHNT